MADEQFAEYLKSMKSASELQLDAEADKDDKVITMSTCTGNSSTRFVIQAKRLEKRRKLKWIKKLKQLQKLISGHQNIVFFGGAGVSTESGIPDFRSVDGYIIRNGIIRRRRF